MKNPDIASAVELYYTKPEIGNSEIRQLFGASPSTAVRYKKMVQQEMAAKNERSWMPHHVNTATAFEVWGIDIHDYEKRLKKIKELGLDKQGGTP